MQRDYRIVRSCPALDATPVTEVVVTQFVRRSYTQRGDTNCLISHPYILADVRLSEQ